MTTVLSTDTLLLLSMPSGGEWIWLILIVVLLFGGKKIPELAKGIGKGIRNFNDAKSGIEDEFRKAGDPAAPAADKAIAEQ